MTISIDQPRIYSDYPYVDCIAIYGVGAFLSASLGYSFSYSEAILNLPITSVLKRSYYLSGFLSTVGISYLTIKLQDFVSYSTLL